MKILVSIILLLSLFFIGHEVKSQNVSDFSKVNVGIGMGLDYGGIFGGRLSVLPLKNIALFGAVGYNLLGAGYNVGGAVRLSPDKKYCPTLGVMYGYNAVIKIDGADSYNQTYYGPSISLGLEMKSKTPKRFWNIELILPIRTKEYQDDLQGLKDNPSIEFKSEPLPFAFSIVYHFGL